MAKALVIESKSIGGLVSVIASGLYGEDYPCMPEDVYKTIEMASTIITGYLEDSRQITELAERHLPYCDDIDNLIEIIDETLSDLAINADIDFDGVDQFVVGDDEQLVILIML